MPEIKFSDNPNEETAFVETDGGQRNRAVLTAAVDGEIEFPANPNSTKVTVTVDGVKRKAVAVATIAGGGDSHNKGYFATLAELQEAYPTAEAGDWAIVGSTDTVWIWDTDNSEWVDSDQKGQVTSVNGQTGDVVLDLLPDQTGNAGKFLTTDGTDASWSDKPLVNTATGNHSISFGAGNLPAFSSGTNNIVIGADSGSIGSSEKCVIIGRAARANTNNAIILGNGGVNSGAGIAIGNQAVANNGSIQFTMGTVASGSSWITNSDANTFKVANANGNFEIMSADGTVPTARLTKVNTTATLAVADWSSNTQTVNVTGMTANGVVLVSPTPANQSAYTSAGILCTAQAAGTLTFTCDTVPSADITVTVVML